MIGISCSILNLSTAVYNILFRNLACSKFITNITGKIRTYLCSSLSAFYLDLSFLFKQAWKASAALDVYKAFLIGLGNL